jgi:phage/plasmid primase-like uncharacterized protein
MTVHNFHEMNAVALAAGLPLLWYPKAIQRGATLRLGNIEGDAGGSLWICLSTGRWKDHSTGQGGGDVISLFAEREKLSQLDALFAIRTQINHLPLAQIQPRRKAQDHSKLARQVWNKSNQINLTVGDSYLRSRGIESIPATLRFQPISYNSVKKQSYPAVIAAVVKWPSSTVSAVQRTFLVGGKKLDGEAARLTLGPIKGGAVRLGPLTKTLALAEGVETALSYQQLTGVTTWATLGAGNFMNLVLPEAVEELLIAADNDARGLTQAYAAAAHWLSNGINVRVDAPPASGTDWNDFLRRRS